jgi:hypothetical protein
MKVSEHQACALLALYRTPAAGDETTGERAEDYFTQDELRLAEVFRLTFHLAAIAKADGRPVEGPALEQMAARIYNVSVDDVRAALAMFTADVRLAEWVAAAIDKHQMMQPPIAETSQQATA